MNWFEIALVGAVLVGATAGTVLVVRQPVFWSGLIIAMLKAALPIVTKRLPADKEQEWRNATRHADGGDEWARKHRGQPPKG